MSLPLPLPVSCVPGVMEFGDVALQLWIAVVFAIISSTLSYNLGVEHIYKYEAEISTGQEWLVSTKVTKDVGYRITADAQVVTVWENPQRKEEKLLKIQLENLKLWLPKKKDPVVQHSSDSPLFIERIETTLGRVYYSSSKNLLLQNLQKGLASILQYRSDGVDVLERDVSGICNATYLTDGTMLKKTKSHCVHAAEGKDEEGSLNPLRSATVHFSSSTAYKLDAHNDIQSAVIEEKAEIASNLWSDGKATIHSKTTLKKSETQKKEASVFTETTIADVLTTIKKQYNAEYFEGTIVSSTLPSPQPAHDLTQLAKSYYKNLQTEKLAKLTSASAFLKLLKHFRECSEKEVKKVLENKKLHPILPQLLDLIAFSETATAADVVLQTLLKKGEKDLIERFLLSLSLVAHPKKELITIVLNFLNHPTLDIKRKAAALSTLGALVKAASQTKDTSTQEVLQSAINTLETGLQSCSDDSCALMYLRGLRNAASPKTMKLLVDTAENGGQRAYEALLALRNVGFQNRIAECEAFCQKILHSPSKIQIGSAKAVAVEILLDCSASSKESLKRLLIYLTLEKPNELVTFIISKLFRKMESNRELKSKIKNLLYDKDIPYPHFLLQNGSSISFTKSLMTTANVNFTYGADIEMLPGGLLRRGAFDIDIYKKDNNLNLISVGTFAEGLGSIAGESSEEDESVRAGLDLSVLNVALRPYVFFESTSELMGHVWSGTGSEPTPALQGNFLIADHKEVIILQNGLPVNLQLEGVLSNDLWGSIQISIWNRNSNSKIRNGVAFLMVLSADLEALNDHIEDEITVRGQTKIDFLTYSEFYEAPYRMCIQMVQPQFKFLVDRRKTTSLAGGKFISKRNRKTKYLIPAKSYALHRQNSEHCAAVQSEG